MDKSQWDPDGETEKFILSLVEGGNGTIGNFVRKEVAAGRKFVILDDETWKERDEQVSLAILACLVDKTRAEARGETREVQARKTIASVVAMLYRDVLTAEEELSAREIRGLDETKGGKS